MWVTDKKLLSGPLLLIYQLPKVGSQTIEASLQEAGVKQRIFRIHYLTRRSTRNLRRGLRSAEIGAQWKTDARPQLELQSTLSKGNLYSENFAPGGS